MPLPKRTLLTIAGTGYAGPVEQPTTPNDAQRERRASLTDHPLHTENPYKYTKDGECMFVVDGYCANGYWDYITACARKYGVEVFHDERGLLTVELHGVKVVEGRNDPDMLISIAFEDMCRELYEMGWPTLMGPPTSATGSSNRISQIVVKS